MWATPSGDSLRWYPTIDGGEYGDYDVIKTETYETEDGGEEEREVSERHARLAPAVWLVWVRNAARRNQFLYLGKLYGGMEQASAGAMGIDPAAQTFEPSSLPYNIIRSGTNTLVAKVAKSRPLPMYLPTDGDHRIHKRVRLLNRFVGGLFHKHKAYAHGYTATRDAALYGTGLLYIHEDGEKIALENIYPWECYVDPVDARYGDPRSLYLIRYIDKDVLKTRYPGHEDAIERAPVLDEAFFPIQDVFSVTNRCTVIEAFHLPADPGRSLDGRHTVCLLDETLKDEQYDDADFPIARMRKDIPLAGWWGIGLGDGMSSMQDEINVMAERVQYAHRIVGGQIWFKHSSQNILDTDFNDDIGVVVTYDGPPGTPPVSTNPQPLNPQTYEYFQALPPTAYAFEGISQTSAQSTESQKLTSGIAIQTMDDIETDRFVMFERAHEEFYVDVARLMLKCVRRIAKKYGDFEVFSASRGNGQKIMWCRDVDLDEDSYVVQAWPTSLLPKTPSARLQRVIELSANGIFDRAQVLKLMDLPDTSAEERLLLAPREAAEAQIQHMLECDEPRGDMGYTAPSKFQDLSYAMSRAVQEYNMLVADSIDHGTYYDPSVIARLANLDKYAAACNGMLEDAKKLAMQQAALAQAAPGMTAGAPPASIQQAPQPVPATAPGPMGNLMPPPAQ